MRFVRPTLLSIALFVCAGSECPNARAARAAGSVSNIDFVVHIVACDRSTNFGSTE